MRIFSSEEYPQGSQAWRLLRRGIPTASKFADILTPKKMELSAAADTYIDYLIGSIFDPYFGQEEEYVSYAMKQGQIVEPEAVAYYALERELTVKQVGFITTNDGRFGASPDSLTVSDDKIIGGLECKHAKAEIHIRRLREAAKIRAAGGDDNACLPPEHKGQVHGCLCVTGLPFWDYLSYRPGMPAQLLLRIVPDEYTAKMWAALQEFHKRFAEALEKIRQM